MKENIFYSDKQKLEIGFKNLMILKRDAKEDKHLLDVVMNHLILDAMVINSLHKNQEGVLKTLNVKNVTSFAQSVTYPNLPDIFTQMHQFNCFDKEQTAQMFSKLLENEYKDLFPLDKDWDFLKLKIALVSLDIKLKGAIRKNVVEYLS